MNRTTESASKWLLITAFAIIYLVWGSTYLAIFFAIETLPPFLMAGVRFLVAGVVYYAVVRVKQGYRPTAGNWRAAAVVGTLMLVGGNGMVTWAEQTVPTGLAALLIATVPLWMSLLDWLFFGAPRPAIGVAVGLLLGLFGVALLIGPGKVGGGQVDPAGAVALMAACCFWSLGSLRSRRAALPASPFLSAAMQMIAGGGALLALGTVTGEWDRVDLGALTLKSGLALLYLIVFGSIIALTAYVWLLRVTTSSRVATYAYVNPVVAVVLGYFVVGEALSGHTLAAAAMILAAVLLVVTSPRPGIAKLMIDRAASEKIRPTPATAEPPRMDGGLDPSYRLQSTCGCSD
ncbi:MAG: EamA family transporter [bacterium]|nr:EamA family transporter [bacterium]